MIDGLINLASNIVGLFKAKSDASTTRAQAFANLTNNSNPLNSLWLDLLLLYLFGTMVYNDFALHNHWQHFYTALDPKETFYAIIGGCVLKLGHHYVNKG